MADPTSSPPLAPFLSAYERGRLAWSLPRALAVVPFAPLACHAGAPATAALSLGLVLVAATAFAGWRSGAGMQGALAGVVVAMVPLLIGPLVSARYLCGGGLCFSWCGLGCAAAAAAVGVVAGLAFSRLRRHRLDFAAAALVCGTVGMLLCPVTGVGSAVGAVVGVVAGFGPLLAVARAFQDAPAS